MSNLHRRILVVDDDVDILDLLISILKSENYQVESASNGEAALRKLTAFHPDLILLDMNMPRMSGLGFYHEIYDLKRDQPRYPVLFLTARAEMEETLLELKAEGFLTKPFQVQALLSKIDSIFQKKEGSKEQVLNSGHKHAFILEPDEGFLGRLTVRFLNAGYMVTAAEKADEAEQKLRKECPSIILVRLDMPGAPGDLCAYKLRQLDHLKSVPFILYSFSPDPVEWNVTEQLCKSANLPVPVLAVDESSLFAHAETLLRKSRAA